MKHSISAIIFDENKIQQRVSDLAAQISKDYMDRIPVLVCILKGSFVFLADLCRTLTIPVEIEFMTVSSYGSAAVSSGQIVIGKDISIDIRDKDVIIVEDIVDTGLSLVKIIEHLAAKQPASVKTCVLLDKKICREAEVCVDYKGFEVGSDFIVGYGLDYAEKFRNLPYIGILKEEVYK